MKKRPRQHLRLQRLNSDRMLYDNVAESEKDLKHKIVPDERGKENLGRIRKITSVASQHKVLHYYR